MVPTTPSLRLRQRIQYGHAIAMGPGKVELLRQIAANGSISAAARHMGMSYRRAWQLVETMNQCFLSPLVETAAGGSGGGGARITALGEQVLGLYLRIETKTLKAVTSELTEFQALLAAQPPSDPH